MSGYTELICQNEDTYLKATAVNIIFIWSIILQSHIQLILQMYLDMKRFKSQERSAVFLLLPI